MNRLLLFLGNFSQFNEFHGTRHNVGMDFLKFLIDRKYQNISKERENQFSISYRVDQQILLLPKLGMNESGRALLEYQNSSILEIFIFYDEKDLKLGRLQVKFDGSGGSHNGLASVIKAIGSRFYRVRIGISCPQNDLCSYVLDKFTIEENKVIKSLYSGYLTQITEAILKGEECSKIMNYFNRKDIYEIK